MSLKKEKTERTPLSPNQKTAQKNLKTIWEAKSKQLGLTQQGLGLDWGMTQGAVGHFINGKAALNAENVLRFAKALKVHPAEIDPEIADLLPGTVSHAPTDDICKEIQNLTPPGRRLVRIAIRLAQGGEGDDLFRSLDEK